MSQTGRPCSEKRDFIQMRIDSDQAALRENKKGDLEQTV